MEHRDGEGNLLRIGIFSKLSGISVRMLRHYQEHGVLAPASVDPFTGYRFYSAAQLRQARIVVLMRDAGLTVAQILELLPVVGDPASVRRTIAVARERLERDRAAIATRSLALEALVSTLTNGETMDVAVTTTVLPVMTVASLRKTIPTYYDEARLWEEFGPMCERSGAIFAPEGPSGATFHDPEYREADVDVEVWVRVADAFAPIAPLACVELPERKVVTATLYGPYSGMPEVTEALGAHVARHGLEAGPMFNVYRVSPAQNPDPQSWVTDVCIPVVG